MTGLVLDVRNLLEANPEAAAVLALPEFEDLPSLIGALMHSICKSGELGAIVTHIYRDTPDLLALTEYDIAQTATRNFEPGGAAATLLFARGVHAIIGYRVTHKLWRDGDTTLALTLKAAFGRAFSTDIHPAAQIGGGLWLDHGLGFVVGETCVIEGDVSIWHNVTLGSTLADDGPNRHPHICRGAVIGAGATVLGKVTIGAGANIAAGANVVQDVPAQSTVVGAKSREVGPAKISFVETADDA